MLSYFCVNFIKNKQFLFKSYYFLIFVQSRKIPGLYIWNPGKSRSRDCKNCLKIYNPTLRRRRHNRYAAAASPTVYPSAVQASSKIPPFKRHQKYRRSSVIRNTVVQVSSEKPPIRHHQKYHHCDLSLQVCGIKILILLEWVREFTNIWKLRWVHEIELGWT